MSHKSADEINKRNITAYGPSWEFYDDEVKKLRDAIGLLNSMVNGGEQHSEYSLKVVAEAMNVIKKITQLDGRC